MSFFTACIQFSSYTFPPVSKKDSNTFLGDTLACFQCKYVATGNQVSNLLFTSTYYVQDQNIADSREYQQGAWVNRKVITGSDIESLYPTTT